MAPPVRLKLDGKAFDLQVRRPIEIKIKAFLDKAAPDEIFTTLELARKIGTSHLSAQRSAREYAESIPTYTHRVGMNRYWGNPKAIAELLRQVKHEGE